MTITNGAADTIQHTNGANGAAPAPNIGTVRPADIVGEMQVAYLDYAMSVIVARALPDARDGLKPVHRRILYAMYADLGLTHDKPHKKSARIVGEVLGKYHPHGDVAVYDAMARMAQDFSLRYPLVDGQGNFGSIDGDSPAAMRYTEARLAEISNLILDDLEKETIAWTPNFDNSLEEPTVLPAALPNLLINGANGIAVGMATNIPPHNLGEVVDALAFLIDHHAQIDEITTEQLMRFVQGPDFPTGGILYRYRTDGKNEEEIDAIAQGYSVGRSRMVMQAKAHFEEISRGRSRIIVTELPYQTNKSSLIERIADLVRDGKVEGISDLRDESDRTGMRIVIELTRNADPKTILADLFKYTPLQQTFGMQLLALVDGQPRMLSLKRALQLFIQHRQEIIRRRSEFDLRRARERAHIVEGLLKALDIIDEVIQTIRSSQRVDTARNNLVKNFGFTEVQAQAILDMQLRRLAALERTRLKDEYKALRDRIAELEDLLAHPEKVLALIKTELLAIKEKYGDARRTQIVDRTKGTLTTTDLLPDQTVWVSVSSKGELRRQEVGKLSNTALRQAGRGSDVAVVTANTREPLYLFSTDGRCTRVAIHEIPADGKAELASELGKLSRGDRIAAALTLPATESVPESADQPQGYLFFVTEQGVVKRITQVDLRNANFGAPTVIAVADKDRLGWVFATQGNQEVILVTASGQAIRFAEDEVRSMGLAAGGVGGVKLKKGDKVVYAAVVDLAGELVTLTAEGFAKRTALAEYPSQGRNGGGIVTHKPNERTGLVSAALLLAAAAKGETVVAVTKKGVPKLSAHSEIPAMGRGVQGKQVVDATHSDPVVVIHRIVSATESAAPEAPSEASPTPGPPTDLTPRSVRARADAKPPRAGKGMTPVRAAPMTTPRPRAGDAKANVTSSAAPPPAGKVAPQKRAKGQAAQPATTNVRADVGASTKANDKPSAQGKEKGVATTQPSLFAVEDATPAPAGGGRAKRPQKLQTVVSVPPGQAKKKG